MQKVSFYLACLTIAVAIFFGISMVAESQTPSGQSTPAQYKPSPSVKNMAQSPQPGHTARNQSKQATIGDDDLDDDVMVDTGHTNNSHWIEEIDLDGKGVMTTTKVMWDDTDRILYMYTDDKPLMCTNGQKADGDFMIATFAAGNKAKNPVGSGWWMADFDLAECGVKREGTYGCKFNAQGENTACGLVAVDNKTHELTIIEAFRTGH